MGGKAGMALGTALVVAVLAILFAGVRFGHDASGTAVEDAAPADVPGGETSDGIAVGTQRPAASVGTDLATTSIPASASDEPDIATATDAASDAAPALDLVRIEADGAAIVAGQGTGDAEITLTLDGREVGRAAPDASGNFVAFLDIPAARSPQVLSIETRAADGRRIRGAESVIVAPAAVAVPPDMQRSPAAVVAATSVPESAAEPVGADPVEADVRVAVGPTAEVQPSDTPRPEATLTSATRPEAAPVSTAPAAPRLFRAGPAGLRVETAAADGDDGLGIDAIAYDEAGAVQLTGRGDSATSLRVYLDGQPVRDIAVGEGGVWAAPLPDVDQGLYTLRIDALDPSGTVVGRVETPFERTAAAAAARSSGGGAVTVQPGYTLWALSEGYFGSGVQYVQIFDANRDLIRDPDLIYPGQIFTLPLIAD